MPPCGQVPPATPSELASPHPSALRIQEEQTHPRSSENGTEKQIHWPPRSMPLRHQCQRSWGTDRVPALHPVPPTGTAGQKRRENSTRSNRSAGISLRPWHLLRS